MIIELKKLTTCIDFESIITQSRGFIKSMTSNPDGSFSFVIDDAKYNALTAAKKQAIRDRIQTMFPHMILSVKEVAK